MSIAGKYVACHPGESLDTEMYQDCANSGNPISPVCDLTLHFKKATITDKLGVCGV